MHSIDLVPLVYFMRNEIGVGSSNWSLTVYKYRRKHDACIWILYHAQRTIQLKFLAVAMHHSTLLLQLHLFAYLLSHLHLLHLLRYVRCLSFMLVLLFPFRIVLFAFRLYPLSSLFPSSLSFSSQLFARKTRFFGHCVDVGVSDCFYYIMVILRGNQCVWQSSHPYQWAALYTIHTHGFPFPK